MNRPNRSPAQRLLPALLAAGFIASASAETSGCSSPDPEPSAVRPAPVAAPAGSSGSHLAAPLAEVPGKMVFEGPGEKLVQNVAGWKIEAAPRYFGPDNLYDLINGGAEIYLQFGLVKMVTSEYRNASRPGLAVTVEIYDLGTAKGAFGRAARFLEGRRDPSGAGGGLPPAFADRGMMGDGDLVVWQDRYLVHLTLIDENPQATPDGIAAAGVEHLPRIMEALLAGIRGETALPAVLVRFPAESRVRRSETWQPGRLLDIEGLGAGYTVRYADGERAWLAFATEEFPSAETAEAAWAAVKSSLADGRLVAIKVAGKRVVGIVQDGEAPLPDALVERLTNALRGAFATQ